MNYIQLLTTETNTSQLEILIALLADNGFEGFEETENKLKAFIPEALFSKEKTDEIFNLLQLSYDLTIVQPQNWNAQWERSFNPVQVADFAAIRANFHQPIPGVKHDIVITPKMSFGTGHHATTYLMMEQMQALPFAGNTVLDFGTGTGVLAILAHKLGAARVIATDNDEWSINNAKENFETNGCDSIQLIAANNLPKGLPAVDIILANINLNVILANLPALQAICTEQTIALFSGLLKEDEQQITEAFKTKGLSIVNILQRNGWICLHTIYSKAKS